MSYRVGIGYDIHRFIEGRPLVLGGVEIPYVLGLLGHSDGDVLLHAICDALLGAVSAGDIGEHFSDTDPKYQGIPSVELLKAVYESMEEQGFLIENIDAIVIAKQPSLVPFKREMQRKIAAALKIEETRVNIKAKTNNGMGDLGNGEAIASYATVLVSKGE